MKSPNNSLKTATLVLFSLLFSTLIYAGNLGEANNFISKRPAINDRKFSSSAVEAKIAEVKKLIKDDELRWLFENCFPNTLDTTVKLRYINGKPYTYVITGDIDAMWLRDSSAQVWPYLTLMKNDKKLQELIAGVINQQTTFILLDPYANAFYDDPNREGEWKDDKTDMKKGIHERKWEIDSPCYVIRLAFGYWNQTGDASIFDNDWVAAMKLIVKTFKEQQRKENRGSYYWMRPGEMEIEGGYGRPSKPTGLIYSLFRPSDDVTLLPNLIPSNLFAVVSLRQLSELFTKTGLDQKFAKECDDLANEVEAAVYKYGVVNKQSDEKVFAYEVDGFGSVYFADDANVPSLLSLPYIGAVKRNDPIYERTRNYLLNENTNPYYVKGKAGEGISSPHIAKDMIWPMAIILRAMTSTDKKEIEDCLVLLKNTHAGKGFMHESFFKEDATKFTRDWFAWANTLFGELIIKVANENPEILKKI